MDNYTQHITKIVHDFLGLCRSVVDDRNDIARMREALVDEKDDIIHWLSMADITAAQQTAACDRLKEVTAAIHQLGCDNEAAKIFQEWKLEQHHEIERLSSCFEKLNAIELDRENTSYTLKTNKLVDIDHRAVQSNTLTLNTK